MKEKKTVLKICCSEWKNASRDTRELNVCRSLGMDVTVIAKGANNCIDNVNGFKVYRLTTKPLGSYFPGSINKIISLFTWAHKARQLSPNIISGHDLEGLLIGYLSIVFRKQGRRPKLVYDAHEFELGRSRTTGHRLNYFVCSRLEKFLMKRSSLSVFVSERIMQETLRIHRINTPSIVVRNIPLRWQINDDAIKEKRRYFESIFGENQLVLMYHGALFEHRGIEQMLQILSKRDNFSAFILGNGSKTYEDYLKKYVNSLGLNKRVCFHSFVPMDELLPFVGAADIGFAIMEPSTLSYYYSLPNKLFENIQALTPVIVSDFPELRAIIEHYHVGVAVNPTSLDEMLNAVDLWNDSSFVSSLAKNLAVAKEELCWENEKQVLIDAYNAL